MTIRRVGRHAMVALAIVAMLAIGATTATAKDDNDTTLYDVVTAEVAEAYPEPAPPVAAGGGLALQPPPVSWDIVVGSSCPDPYSCDSVP